MKSITITIDRVGGTIVKTEGFTGGTCKDVTKNLQKALGKTSTDINTNEMYEINNEQNNLNQY